MKYDIFLGGPWEKRCLVPYKSMIKEAFPDKKIFDPEERTAQETGGWFVDNYKALKSSLAMVAFIPNFPFPGVGPEVGLFYEMHSKSPKKPLEEIVIIWSDIVKPDYGKKVAEKFGYVVEDTEEAIVRLKALLKS